MKITISGKGIAAVAASTIGLAGVAALSQSKMPFSREVYSGELVHNMGEFAESAHALTTLTGNRSEARQSTEVNLMNNQSEQIAERLRMAGELYEKLGQDLDKCRQAFDEYKKAN